MKIYIKSSQEVDDLEAKIAWLEHDIDSGEYANDEEREEMEQALNNYYDELESARQSYSASSTRSKIASIEDRIALLQDSLSDPNIDEDEKVDIQLELNELEDDLRFAWQEDEEDWDYARETQEFNPDGSLKWY